MSNKNKKAGFGLLEVMIAALIIAIMVIGGAATMSHTGTNVQEQGLKRVAMQLAELRMEDAKSNDYYAIKPGDYFEDTGRIYYLTEKSGSPHVLERSNSLKTETITVNGVDYVMTTTIVRYKSVFNPECIRVTASVEYRADTNEEVSFSTLILDPSVAN